MNKPDPKAQADALVQRGRELLDAGQLPEATDLLNQAVKLYWSVGEQYTAAAQIGNYGWALRRNGRPDLARPYLEEAARLFGAMGLKDYAERHQFAAEDVNPVVTEAFLASLPPAVRGALERGDVGGLQFALDALGIAERELVIERLGAAGLITIDEGAADKQTAEAIRQFGPLLQGIAAVARGESADRADIEATLDELERKGWKLRSAVLALWRGERRLDVLADGLDDIDRALVRHILELIPVR